MNDQECKDINYIQILNHLNDGYVIQDKDARIISFNDRACEILGLSRDQLLGRSSMDPTWKAVRADGSDFPGEEHPAVVTIKMEKSCKNVIMGIQTKDNEPRWISINSFPFSEEFEGVKAKVLCIFSDITKHFTTELFFHGLVHNIPGMIYQFKLDAQGKASFPFVTNASYDIFEIDEQSLMKTPDLFIQMIHEEDRQGQQEATLKSLHEMSDFDWTGRIVTPAQIIKWIRVKSTPRKERDGTVIWEGIVTDITKEVHLAEELNLERIKATHAAKLASLGEMSAGIAHEINNPLMIITSASKLLHHYNSDHAKFEEKLTQIEKSVERITKIVGGLKRFSRIKKENDKVVTDIKTIIENASPFMTIKATENEIDLKINNYSQSKIFCNSIEIEQTIINLVNNSSDAIKNCDEKWIRVDIQDIRNAVLVSVTDSGPGIPANVLEKIFDPFFTTKNIGEGTGLGLSISRSIVMEHGGEIYVDPSTPNTRFIVKLPVSCNG